MYPTTPHGQISTYGTKERKMPLTIPAAFANSTHSSGYVQPKFLTET